jgi:uncharacterized protein (TIGR04255 family)
MLSPHTEASRLASDARGRRIYKRPPVVEAVVDIQVTPLDGLEIADLARLQSGDQERYPDCQQLFSGSLTLDSRNAAVVASQSSLAGYRLANSDSTVVVQSRLQSFTFSRLAPYSPWESWIGEAERLWMKYLSVARPQSVNRIAVRYINRIEFAPSEGRRVRDYLKVYPEVPDTLPTRLSGILMRLELVPAELPGSTLVITVGRTEPIVAGNVALLLDIDLALGVAKGCSDPAVWESVQDLHLRENDFFESCISDLSRELFD